MQSALEVNQQQLVQKSNDLKRVREFAHRITTLKQHIQRETEIQELRVRVKDLEKQLIEQLRQKVEPQSCVCSPGPTYLQESGPHLQETPAQAPLIRAQDVVHTSSPVGKEALSTTVSASAIMIVIICRSAQAAPEHDPTMRSATPIRPLTPEQIPQECPRERKSSRAEPMKFSAMNERSSSDYLTDWSELPQPPPVTRLGKRAREEGTALSMTRSSRRRKITNGDVVSGAMTSRVRTAIETVPKQKKRR